MAQYIDKDDLISKIKDLKLKLNWALEDFSGAKEIAYDNVLDAIYGSEVKKEVDLEKALSDLDKDIKEFVITEEFEKESETCGHYWTIAKHAFLLGLKAQKGE